MRRSNGMGWGATLLAAAMSAAVASAACSSSGSGGVTGPDTLPHPAGTHVFIGGMAGLVSHNGLVTITINDTGTTSPVTASYKPIGGAAVAMSGTLDRGSGALNFGGSSYGVSSLLASGMFTGAWTLSTTDSGAFAAVSDSGTPVAFCGSFTNTNGGGADTGVAVMLINGTAGKLVVANRVGNGGGQVFPVSRSGNTVTITPQNGSASGTISGSSITGVIKDSVGTTTGSFSASAANCAA